MRALNEKKYQFLKLCISLTKQGFNFVKDPINEFQLIFDNSNRKRLTHPETKLPFVDSIQFNDINTNSIYFNQWSDKFLKIK
jgi:hypothetical protein